MSTESKEPRGYAYLSDGLQGDPPFTVHGTALGVNDITLGGSGIKKLWTPDALRGAAETLQGQPIVKNHVNNDVDQVIGQVTEAKFREGVGVIFEGEISDRDIAEKISRKWLEVSPRILHQPVDEMEENEDGAKVVTEIREFINLAVVTHGASPSNSVESGPASNLSAAELQAAFDYSPQDAGSADEEEAEGQTSDESDDAPSDADELEQHAVHEPDWSGLSESRWQKPSLEDFTNDSWEDLSTDEKNSIADHFIVSKTGFPPETFGDLALPVVSSDGNLNENAVDNAASRVGQVSGLSGEDLSRAESIIDQLQGKFDDEEQNEAGDDGPDRSGVSFLMKPPRPAERSAVTFH